jgi:hypothetical protein
MERLIRFLLYRNRIFLCCLSFVSGPFLRHTPDIFLVRHTLCPLRNAWDNILAGALGFSSIYYQHWCLSLPQQAFTSASSFILSDGSWGWLISMLYQHYGVLVVSVECVFPLLWLQPGLKKRSLEPRQWRSMFSLTLVRQPSQDIPVTV